MYDNQRIIYLYLLKKNWFGGGFSGKINALLDVKCVISMNISELYSNLFGVNWCIFKCNYYFGLQMAAV